MKQIIDARVFMANPANHVIEIIWNCTDSVNVKEFLSFADLQIYFGVPLPVDCKNKYDRIKFKSNKEAQKFIDDNLMPRFVFKELCNA